MGVTLLYRAIPKQTSLFRRLRSDRKLNILFVKLFPYGSGPFDAANMEPAELEEVLAWIAQDEAFATPAEFERRNCSEVRATRRRTTARSLSGGQAFYAEAAVHREAVLMCVG